jgi:hypothetical protein
MVSSGNEQRDTERERNSEPDLFVAGGSGASQGLLDVAVVLGRVEERVLLDEA